MDKARLVWVDGEQFVLLPMEFRFKHTEVVIYRNNATGDVVMSEIEPSWESFDMQTNAADVPQDFMDDREQGAQDRDPFDGWNASLAG
jgi:antitoxin VapB